MASRSVLFAPSLAAQAGVVSPHVQHCGRQRAAGNMAGC